MCPCYKEEFVAAGIDCIKHSIHCERKSRRKHFLTCISASMTHLEQILFLEKIAI